MTIIGMLIWLVILVICFSFAIWVVNNYLPAPFQKYAILVLALIGVIVLVWLLLGLTGMGGITFPRPHGLSILLM